MARMTPLQRLLVDHIKQVGGKHIYISRAWSAPAGSPLLGYTWEGVNLSLQALVRRGVLRVEKQSFFYLADEQK